MATIKGLGLGIIYLPRLDCITQYFDKKRPLVTGYPHHDCQYHQKTFLESLVPNQILEILNIIWNENVMIICRHRHLWLRHWNIHLCSTHWLVNVIIMTIIIIIMIRLLTTFSWQTALLILGGICVGNCFFALLFKPIPESYKVEDILLIENKSEQMQMLMNCSHFRW